MPTTTINLGLIKPSVDDFYNVNDQNENMDIIDAELKENADALATHKADYLKHTGYANATGSANTYIATLSPALSSYQEGVSLRLKINVANTGASTVNVNGLGAKAIKKADGTEVSSGNLKAGGVYTLAYGGSSFILQGEGGGLSDLERLEMINNINSIAQM